MIEATGAYAVSRDGTKIYWEMQHGSAQMPPLLLVHGIGGDLDAWHYVQVSLLAAGYGSITFDLRGHGYSDHPRRRKAYSVERFYEDILEAMSATDAARVVVAGHSGGAVLAMQFAERYPEKIAGLIVINGSASVPNYLRSPWLYALSRAAIEIGITISPPSPGRWHSSYPPGKYHKEFEWYGLLRTIYHNSLRSYLLHCRAYISHDLGSKLGNLLIPTLIIAGEQDSIYPLKHSEELHARILHSELAVVPKANHVSILNNSDEVAGLIIAFLSKNFFPE